MTQNIDLTILEDRYRVFRPYWFPTAWSDAARALAENLSPLLIPVLTHWLTTGEELDFRHGRYALSDFMALTGSDYLGAMEQMNLWIRNPRELESQLFQF